jgi:hypothetical protein
LLFFRFAQDVAHIDEGYRALRRIQRPRASFSLAGFQVTFIGRFWVTAEARQRGSVLILSDFTGASFDEEAIRTMKETAVFDKPYIKKSAWVGAEDLPELFSENVKSFSRREFPTFKSREEALTWLAKD